MTNLRVNLAAKPEGARRVIRKWAPCATLRPYILSFDLRDDRIGANQIVSPLTARNDCFLQFHLKEPYWVVTNSTGELHRSPTRILVGPHTQRREDLIWTGELKVFTIRFSSVGFRSVFGIPASQIRDIATNAELILGPELLSLEALLAEVEDNRMPWVAEDFLLARLARQRVNTHAAAVLGMTACIEGSRNSAALHGVAARHNLGVRQMERLFQEYVGVSPKVFERLHRTKQAMSLQRANPGLDWASIAAASGYFDQAHFIRDFRRQNATTPAEFALRGLLAHEFRAASTRNPDRMSHLYNRQIRTGR